MATNQQKQLAESKKKLQDDVIQLIRACLISVKGEISLDQLKKDYKSLSGSDIPFRELDHASLASFLQAFPQKFSVINKRGLIFVNTIDVGNAKHIQKLVNGQKSASRKPKKQNRSVRQPKNQNNWTPPPNRHYKVGRGFGDRMVHNQMTPRLYDPGRTDLKTKNFYTQGRWLLPRATRDTEKQYAAYFQVPPRFNNNLDAKLGEGKPGGKSFKKTLEEYVVDIGIKDTIVVNCIPEDKKGKAWLCSIKIGEYRFICYPTTFSSSVEAEEATSKIALDNLKKMFSPPPSTTLQPTTDFDTTVERVRQIVGQELGGLLWESVKVEYKKKYNEILPPDWPQQVIAKAIRGIIIEKLYDGRYSIKSLLPLPQPYLVSPPPPPPLNHMMYSPPDPWLGVHASPPHSCVSPPISPRSDNSIDIQALNLSDNTGTEEEYPPSLKLPESRYFNVNVTVVKDSSDFCLRLLGEGYSIQFENLVTDMELFYMDDTNRVLAREIVCGGYYACSLEESWFRVQILSSSDNKATVFFVDHGDEEEMQLSNLFILPKEKFLRLPFQHVRCSLAGLEFCKDQNVTTTLQQMAFGKPLVAEVLSRDDKSLSVILFDTSTDDDVNINKQLLEIVPQCYLEPKLPPPGGVVEVYYSFMSPEGELYVSIESETYNSLMVMLDTAKKLLGNEDVSIDMTKLYLAKFSQDGDWHRAIPRSGPTNSQVPMYFVDWGNSEDVALSDVRSFDKVTPLLHKIPHQAIACRLHNVPPSSGLQWTSRTSQRFVGLISVDQPLLLKVVTEGTEDTPPSVEVFKRIEPLNELVSINQTLAIDATIFSGDGKVCLGGDSNNNKRETLSKTHSRNSSNASLTSSGINSGPSSLTSLTASPPPSLGLHDCGELPPPHIPALGEFYDVYITFAANPFNFAMQGRKSLGKFSALSKQMNEFYNKSDNLKVAQVTGSLKEGCHYAIKHTDGTWYRARIDRVISNVAAGLFVDFGDQFGINISPDVVCELQSKFKTLPYQAVKGKLTGIKPVNKDWTPEDSVRFRNLTQNKEFVSVVKKVSPSINDRMATLELCLVDTSNPAYDVHIDQVLIKEGIALKL